MTRAGVRRVGVAALTLFALGFLARFIYLLTHHGDEGPFLGTAFFLAFGGSYLVAVTASVISSSRRSPRVSVQILWYVVIVPKLSGLVPGVVVSVTDTTHWVVHDTGLLALTAYTLWSCSRLLRTPSETVEAMVAADVAGDSSG